MAFKIPSLWRSFLEKIEGCDGFDCVDEKGEKIYISIDEGDDYFFALRFWYDKPKQTISLICYTPVVIATETQIRFTREPLTTLELRDYITPPQRSIIWYSLAKKKRIKSFWSISSKRFLQPME